MEVFKNILVATDFSECSERAVALAIELAKKMGAELTVVHVWELPPMTYADLEYPSFDMFTPLEQAAQQQLDSVVANVRAFHPRAKAILQSGGAAPQILEVAKRIGADLLVLGTHGRRGAQHLLMGSVAERVVRLAPIPVLTVHAGAMPQPAMASRASQPSHA